MSAMRATGNRADRYWTAALTAIILLAAVLRIGAVHYANTHADKFMWPDSQRYLQAAANVAAGNGPIVSPANRTGVDPGYPLLLSWPMRVWPGDVDKVAAAARWINVAAGLATVIFTAYLGRLLFGSLAGLVAAGILAVQPIQVYFHALVLTEVIYTTLLMGSLYALARYMLSGGGVNLFSCAIGLGLATLIRSSGLFLPVLLLPLIAYAGYRQLSGQGGPRGAAAAVVTFCVCYGCVLMPAAYRNYRRPRGVRAGADRRRREPPGIGRPVGGWRARHAEDPPASVPRRRQRVHPRPDGSCGGVRLHQAGPGPVPAAGGQQVPADLERPDESVRLSQPDL